ncbi:uncharacterized protein I206_100794 [Kwoniella pini CBS 10737]|uniref:Homologous-pairing protein 2 winged helix domain-containing protein n=1 Tax=Kwoniella pini CBS 10737 TaxID=1296096 RepID=A0A1B9IC80_9TREE|nr:uncharacterized protein I206_00533 [Kwoniella pini CBS 10737]OCF53232.1 hypothetical protein I206_00533 [Kwoniella pini CBS 10737]
MAPKKEVKEKQVKGDQAEEMVLAYMKETNRPFANADVSANLKNRVPKAAAVKVLATLAEKGQLTVKPYGKQLIYLYNQSLLEVLDPKELASLDKEIKEIKEQLEEKRKELKSLQLDLSSKEALPKTKDLAKEIERVQAENDITLKALAPFRSTSNGEAAINPMSAEETKKIDNDFNKWRKEWTDRRKIYKELLGMLTDGGQIDNTTQFEEDQGIVRDDDEAIEVEKGEFVALSTPIRQIVKRQTTVQKVVNGNGKRNEPNGIVESAEEGAKKKKAKKA